MAELWDKGGAWSPWIFVILVVVGILIVNRLIHWALRFLKHHTSPTKQVGLNAFWAALDSPLRLLVWLTGIAIAMRAFWPNGAHALVDQYLPLTWRLLVVLVVSWLFFRLVKRIIANVELKAAERGETVDPTATDAIGKLLRVVIFVFMVMSIMQILGVSMTGLLAFGGAAGIAVGFAAQTLVANLFGGLTIFASKIFKIGEDIIIPGTTLSGTVKHIGWRSTHVLGWDGKPFYVPNSLFNSSNMINHSRLLHRAMSENILLRYEDYGHIRDIVAEANDALNQRDDLNYFVINFNGFGDNALKINVYAWVQSVPYGHFVPYATFCRVKQDILLTVADIAHQHGAKVLPLNRVQLQNEPQEPMQAKPL